MGRQPLWDPLWGPCAGWPVQKPVQLAPRWCFQVVETGCGGLSYQLFAMIALFRNQQVASSILAGGSMLKRLNASNAGPAGLRKLMQPA